MSLLDQLRNATASEISGGIDDSVVPSLESLLRLRPEARRLGLSQQKKMAAHQAGGYRSAYRGRGIDFEEVRIYQPGDDIRTMDWRVTARTGEPHTKVYREERERPVLFLVDQGPSMMFGTRVAFKSVVAARAAALIAWAALDNNDRVGGLVFRGEHHRELRPTSRRRGVLQLCRALSAGSLDDMNRRAEGNGLNTAMVRFSRIARPGSMVFLITDFREADEETPVHFVRLAGHCDVVALLVYDPMEATPPQPGRYPVTDGAAFLTLDTTPAGARQAYRDILSDRIDAVSSMCRQNGAHFHPLSSHESLTQSLRQCLRHRYH